MKQLREGLRVVSNSLKPDRSVLTFSRSPISGLHVAFNEKVGIINEKKVGKCRTACKLVIWVDLLCFCSVLCLLCFVRVCLYVLCDHLLGKG